MTTPRISPKLTTPVWAAFRRHSHYLFTIGYREALPRIHSEPDEETDITGYICEALEEWFLRNPREAAGFFLKDDPPLRKSGKTGKRRPRTDIVIGYAAGVRPEFFFESKRLHRKKAIGSRYTAAEGMGCFISGRYASSYAEAAMIGYVQTDTLERWCAELQQRVRNEAVELKLESTDSSVTFASAFPLEWASTHRRAGLGPIKLFHIVLDCRSSIAAGA
ncbi:MAG TPA: hypothetical protein VMW24_06080 [Sedimentisphaerales bacterium]|nr:hypothetical protein [Sedimentisphaerales bacterium]